MADLKFVVANSFATAHFGGNPCAVFPDADALPDETMQAIARQMNLVETVFALKPTRPGADFRLRYFTPEEELPVAGHPTIAACVVLARAGAVRPDAGTPCHVETGKGVLAVSICDSADGLDVFMEQPAPIFGDTVSDRAAVADVLGISEDDLISSLPVVPVDTGLGHLIVPVSSLRALMNVKRDIPRLRALCDSFGMREAQAFAFESLDAANHLHTRNICPREGLEDPACGSGNGALSAYLAKYRYAGEAGFEIRAEQGNVVNVPSLIVSRVSAQGGGWSVRVGGSARVMIEGRFFLNEQ